MKNKFAVTTLVGLVGGIACVAIAIAEAGNLQLFINIPSLLIIVGGTTCSLIMSFPFETLRTIGSVIKQSFIKNRMDLEKDIEILVELADQARREGILSIEDYVQECEDPFFRRALTMMVDGHSKEDVEDTMVNVVYQMQKRHRNGYAMINMIATLAPALGLVGTYVGLIPMLVSLDDPTKLGPLMAIELVSSFYGAFLAYVVFSPMAKKLIIKSEQEKARNEMLLEGILSMMDGKNPRIIREDLQAYLTKKDAMQVPQLRRRPSSDDTPESSARQVISYQAQAKKQRGA